MTPDEAAWVREHAWTTPMRNQYAETPDYFRTCACQWGPCGWCAQGRHEKCRNPGIELMSPTVIVSRRGSPAVLHYPYAPMGKPVQANVWEIGHRHVWRCPCKDQHVERAEQGELFAAYLVMGTR